MKFNRLLAAAIGLAACVSAFADGPFRAHRYDSFQATPTVEGQIVFAGNSITNMHSWFEAFGSHQEVIGRGNSGGYAYELIEQMESYIDAKPAKLFVMIGTNDISSGVPYQLTAKRIQTIARRVRLESPNTEIYLQSILPRSSNAKPDYELCNTLVREFVENLNDEKVHFINLSEVCAGINGNGAWSHDGLHPRPKGYAAWTHAIEDKVGYTSVYPQEITEQNSCGLAGSNAGRVEQFPYFPVSEGDVLFFGDEQVHGGEWHELLRSNKIKDRSQLWGWGGIPLANAKNVVASSLSGQAVKPSKIFLFYGIGGKDATAYRAIVDEAKTQAPDAKIYIVSLTPSTHADTNTANVNFNTELQTIATEKGATYVDIYTPLNESISTNIMHTNYVSGRGYVVMANELAKYLTEEQVNPVSLTEYDAVYAKRANRKIVGNALTTALMLEYGDKPGQIKETHRAAIEAAITAAVEAVGDADITAEKANAAAQALNEVVATAANDLNYPTASTEGDEHWYVLTSTRNGKAVTATGMKLFGENAPTSSTIGYNIWKFVSRDDNTYDIVNYNGQYINPIAAKSAQMSVMESQPSAGFTLGASSAAAGTFVIYSADNSQLNQTSLTGLPIYSWYSSTIPDLTDDGCSYSLTEFDGEMVDIMNSPALSGWYEIRGAATDNTDYIRNDDNIYNQSNNNFYPLFWSPEKPEADKAPVGWVYIDVVNGEHRVQAANGWHIGASVTGVRAAYNTPITDGTTAGTYVAPGWQKFPTLTNASGLPILGKAGSVAVPLTFTRVSDADLAAYDVWTVKILDTNADKIINDTHVTLNSEANHGIATAYNGGRFFLTPGSTISESDLTVVKANADAEYTVEIRPETKTIVVGNSSITISGSGWYEIQRCDNSKWVTNLSELSKQTSTNLNYSLQYNATKPSGDNVATGWVYLNVNEGGIAVQPLIGQYIGEYTANVRDSYNCRIVESTSAYAASYNVQYWIAFTNNGIADVIGRSYSADAPHYFFRANTADYDIYKVNIEETPAEDLINDTKVTLATKSGVTNYGLATVYNGGAFVVNKDAVLSAEDFTVTPAVGVTQEGEHTKIEIDAEAKTVSVSFGEVDAIAELEATTESAATVYDLWGRRVATPRHGLYIVNGRKVRL